MFERLLLPWQQILLFYSMFRTTPEVSSKLYFVEILDVKSQRSYGLLITKEMIFGFQILDLKVHFSASLTGNIEFHLSNYPKT